MEDQVAMIQSQRSTRRGAKPQQEDHRSKKASYQLEKDDDEYEEDEEEEADTVVGVRVDDTAEGPSEVQHSTT